MEGNVARENNIQEATEQCQPDDGNTNMDVMMMREVAGRNGDTQSGGPDGACPECGDVFSGYLGLQLHMRAHTRRRSTQMLLPPSTQETSLGPKKKKE